LPPRRIKHEQAPLRQKETSRVPNAVMNPILLLLLLVKTAASLSGCEVCASYGQCNAAFHNGPGQYCGSFYDISTSGNKPCCCPLQSTCKVSPTQCSCHVSNPHPTPPANYYPSSQHYSSRPQTTYYNEYQTTSPFAIFFFIVICCCCALCSRQRGEHYGDGRIPLATAVPATCPPSENPAHYTHNFNYGSTPSYGPPSSGGAGAAIASGLGGLAFGTVVGNLMGRNNNAQGNSMPQFGGGYQGGYDIAGDSGDGYNIAGDSGDGGFDIAGDSGD